MNSALAALLNDQGYVQVSYINPWYIWYRSQPATTLLVSEQKQTIGVYAEHRQEPEQVFDGETRLVIGILGYRIDYQPRA